MEGTAAEVLFRRFPRRSGGYREQRQRERQNVYPGDPRDGGEGAATEGSGRGSLLAIPRRRGVEGDGGDVIISGSASSWRTTAPSCCSPALAPAARLSYRAVLVG